MAKTDINPIYTFNGLDTFLKVKPDMLDKDRVILSFVHFDKNTKKTIDNIDIFMKLSEMATLVHKIETESFFMDAESSYEEDEKYPKPFWQSELGGTSEEAAKERGLRTDGKAISRCFNISVGAKKNDGSRNAFVITALQKPGHSTPNKLIVPDSGAKPEKIIRVPIMKNEELMAFAKIFSWHVTAALTARYKDVF